MAGSGVGTYGDVGGGGYCWCETELIGLTQLTSVCEGEDGGYVGDGVLVGVILALGGASVFALGSLFDGKLSPGSSAMNVFCGAEMVGVGASSS